MNWPLLIGILLIVGGAGYLYNHYLASAFNPHPHRAAINRLHELYYHTELWTPEQAVEYIMLAGRFGPVNLTIVQVVVEKLQFPETLTVPGWFFMENVWPFVKDPIAMRLLDTDGTAIVEFRAEILTTMVIARVSYEAALLRNVTLDLPWHTGANA